MLVIHIDAQRWQPRSHVSSVRIDDFAQQDFSTNGNDFSLHGASVQLSAISRQLSAFAHEALGFGRTPHCHCEAIASARPKQPLAYRCRTKLPYMALTQRRTSN